ncbi:MAG: aminotransferase class I/II-fold pyridoxal phosphate-dependent enzyme [Phenylobacterium sp.]|jgi:aspartate/methionine/tyrosine aminotransferase|uniref:pyridoxal phosphate-dependent aminotransferase n=1 Tax=Phenylobacterium sp. TaxID=1871053 RepID=UPI002A2D6570|nr:aminotransferase class I/II-fold pyridoxal phosphate-dependent enzyme [Phenylobacterium sp.]MDD3836906.1 aminotransferase class I/II-fold pyridoxal phosphate-dependent enzyme [Phenylobacterium sp.]MDX9998460.1 aminotransferase class I/II-fold pyridoxal phosphate-dependent enzyme [Phenylobacterium sp.]
MSDDIEPFYAIGISRIAHQLKAQGRTVLHMEFGQPSTGAPKAAIEVAHQVLDTEPMGYWESTALTQRIARHYRESYGVTVSPEQIILTCGASPALVMALASSFKPGDVVAVARPGYVAYRNTLKALNMIPLELSCGHAERFRLSAAQIAAIDPAPAGLIVASPANPTGAIIPGDELAAIARVCRERGIRIVSDEIYHGLSYGDPARSMLEFEPEALVINSFSKYFSMAGWRLGWMVSPPAHVERARAFMGAMFLTAPSLAQHAALAAMDCREELDGHVEVYRKNRQLLLDALPSLGLTAIAPPDGAFYIYADVGHLTNDSLAFCERLLRETGVATAPGVDFDPVEGRRFIRFSFAVSTAEVEEALSRLKTWFAAQAPARGFAPQRG